MTPDPPKPVYNVRSGQEVQEAHDLLNAIVKKEIPDVWDEGKIGDFKALLIAHDLLCWMLHHDHNLTFQIKLARMKRRLNEMGYALGDVGRPLPPAEFEAAMKAQRRRRR